MLKILLMQTKLRSHSIEYFCFYLNNQLLLFAYNETKLINKLLLVKTVLYTII